MVMKVKIWMSVLFDWMFVKVGNVSTRMVLFGVSVLKDMCSTLQETNALVLIENNKKRKKINNEVFMKKLLYLTPLCGLSIKIFR